jgi:N-methylhydantoinase A
MGLQVGVDIGGTFTDFVVFDEASDVLRGFKSPTIPAAPERGVAQGLAALAGVHPDVALSDVCYFVHGSTIATNTLIQRSGARLALVVTQGFRDVLELGRIRLPDPFNFNSDRPTPLIPRERVFPVRERILADGSVLTALDVDGARQALGQALATGVDAIVVSLLNSYRNPIHEAELRRLVEEISPSTHVSCSHDIWPEIREYERTMVTLINAYVRPQVVRYLGRLRGELHAKGVAVPPLVTKSNGGVMSLTRAIERPVEMLVSGPAAGVLGATRIASMAGFSNLLTFDVGGTSADVAVVVGAEPTYSNEARIGDFPVIVPVVDVSSVGAGGGSIAWCDRQRSLHVGPRSAGADPGPACYGRGGDEPTLTDAFLMSGLLAPDTFCGGRVALDPRLAESAIERLGHKLGLSTDDTADAIISVATATMYAEFTSLMTKRGLDPRDFTLVAFGGAGPALASALAREFHIGQVLIPSEPGTLCAMGALLADVRNDYVASLHVPLHEGRVPDLRAIFASLRRSAREAIRQEKLPVGEWRVEYSADLRYVGQSYEIPIPVKEEDLGDARLLEVVNRFHAEHQRVYGHADKNAPVELITARARLIGCRTAPAFKGAVAQLLRPGANGRRTVRMNGTTQTADIHARAALAPGQTIDGLAIVEQADTTVLIPAGARGEVDGFGNIIIREAR